MDKPEKIDRFSSCRGVAFEIKPHSDLFALPSPATSSRSSWLPWGSFSRVIPSSELLQKSMSRTSSHFCDLDGDDEDFDVDTLADIEEGHEEAKPDQSPLPPPEKKKPSPPTSRLSVILLDQGLFTVYKQLFVVCLVLNITGLVLAVAGEFPYAANRAALFSIVNIFALVLCRSEAVLRVVFWLAVNVLGYSWVPLRIKTITTSLLQSLGGIHSGCGISSVAWLIYALLLTLKDKDNTTPEIIAVAAAILALLCLSSLAAFPLVRHLHHNVFERTHRFSGWTSLILLWAFIILTISYDPLTKSYSNNLSSRLIRSLEFWFTIYFLSKLQLKPTTCT